MREHFDRSASATGCGRPAAAAPAPNLAAHDPFSPPRIDERTVEAVAEAPQQLYHHRSARTGEFERQLAPIVGGARGRPQQLDQRLRAGVAVVRHRTHDEVIVPAYTYCASANIVEHGRHPGAGGYPGRLHPGPGRYSHASCRPPPSASCLSISVGCRRIDHASWPWRRTSRASFRPAARTPQDLWPSAGARCRPFVRRPHRRQAGGPRPTSRASAFTP